MVRTGRTVESEAYVRRRIRELRREIDALEKQFFAPHEKSLFGERWALERKKENLVRLIVIEMHLSIESLITDAIIEYLSPSRRQRLESARSLKTRELYELLEGGQAIRFPAKLTLARALKIVTAPEVKRLLLLNTLRNRCSHHWTLNVVRRWKVKRKSPKKPLLDYEGRSLYGVQNLDQFTSDYAGIYLRLFHRFA